MGNNLLISVALASCFIVSKLVFYSHAVESPKYLLVHSESDYEIRLYREVSWIYALVQETSFEKSTEAGFHRFCFLTH